MGRLHGQLLWFHHALDTCSRVLNLILFSEKTIHSPGRGGGGGGGGHRKDEIVRSTWSSYSEHSEHCFHHFLATQIRAEQKLVIMGKQSTSTIQYTAITLSSMSVHSSRVNIRITIFKPICGSPLLSVLLLLPSNPVANPQYQNFSLAGRISNS